MSKYKSPISIEGSIDKALIFCIGARRLVYPCKVDCMECIFNHDLWTPEREASFLEWEKDQNEL